MLQCGMYIFVQTQNTAGVGPACIYRKDLKNG